MEQSFHTIAMKALESGNIDGARTQFESILSTSPNDIEANYNLGILNLDDNKAKIALPFLQKAAKLRPTIKSIGTLGNCFEALGCHSDAANCYSSILKKTPNECGLWIKYGLMLERDNKQEEAVKAYQEALTIEPSNAEAAIKLGWALWKNEPARATLTLEQALAANTDNKIGRIQLLSTLAVFQEWLARLKINKPPYHAYNLEEMFFPLSQTTLNKLYTESNILLESVPTMEWAQMTAGLAAFASQKYYQAQEIFSKVKTGHLSPMAKAIRLDEDFYNQLNHIEDENIRRGLAPLHDIRTVDFKEKNIIYMACNAHYFDAFAKPLILSINATNVKEQLHIHIMDSSLQHTEEANNFCDGMENIDIALSVERPELSIDSSVKPREYFHAIRFIRFYNHLKHYKKSLWLMDVDGLFNKPPQRIFQKHAGNDIVLRARPGRLEPWNQFNACLVGAHYSETALNYFRYIAKYIYYFFKSGSLPWGIDQLALYATYIQLVRKELAPTIQLLDEEDLDYDHIDSSTLWCSSGTKKFIFFNNMEDINNDELSKYEKRFLEYFKKV